jgi:hypothetical protein
MEENGGEKPSAHQHERKVHAILYEKALADKLPASEAELMEKVSRINGR